MTDKDRFSLESLYRGRKYPQCLAKFAPKKSVGTYFSAVSALQYIFVRDYINQAVLRRISLMFFPTSLVITEFQRGVYEESA